ncbi:hypothetical protein [Chlorogloeopsis sp. ULAP02]|uniref:hypothetical protein n=1 Tax=Chlorogloeopsis sp. ULAP02 TaxID=3107926 RepID=UPI003134B5F9
MHKIEIIILTHGAITQLFVTAKCDRLVISNLPQHFHHEDIIPASVHLGKDFTHETSSRCQVHLGNESL